MNKSMQLIGTTIRRSLWKHHFTIFLVTAASGAALGIYSLLGVINMTTPKNSTSSTNNDAFDQATIDKVNALGSGSDEEIFTLPANQRTDPFLEN